MALTSWRKGRGKESNSDPEQGCDLGCLHDGSFSLVRATPLSYSQSSLGPSGCDDATHGLFKVPLKTQVPCCSLKMFCLLLPPLKLAWILDGRVTVVGWIVTPRMNVYLQSPNVT